VHSGALWCTGAHFQIIAKLVGGKVKLLLKHDAFASNWKVAIFDVADLDEEFKLATWTP
jgi:hypothetical protein